MTDIPSFPAGGYFAPSGHADHPADGRERDAGHPGPPGSIRALVFVLLSNIILPFFLFNSPLHQVQVATSTSLTDITPTAVSLFTPAERKCWQEDEIHLSHLNYSKYR